MVRNGSNISSFLKQIIYFRVRGWGERDWAREREREIKYRESYRENEREGERRKIQRDIETDRYTWTARHTWTDRHTYWQTDGHTYRRTDKQTYILTDRQETERVWIFFSDSHPFYIRLLLLDSFYRLGCKNVIKRKRTETLKRPVTFN